MAGTESDCGWHRVELTCVTDIEIMAGKGLAPVIADNFVLIPNPKICDPNKSYRVEFRALTANPQSATK